MVSGPARLADILRTIEPSKSSFYDGPMVAVPLKGYLFLKAALDRHVVNAWVSFQDETPRVPGEGARAKHSKILGTAVAGYNDLTD